MSSEQPIRQIEDIHGFFRTGTVRGVGNWSETHVSSSSSGGGGHVVNGQGFISSPTVRVSSTNTEVVRFFMEYSEGDEEEVTIKGGGFAVREGQRVTVVRVGSRPGWGYNVAYHNHNTGNTHAPDGWLVWPLGKFPSAAMLLVAPIIGAIVGALLFSGGWWLLGLAGFGWAFYAWNRKAGEYRKLKDAVRQRIAEVLTDAKAEHGRAKTGVAGDVA
jgi:hypothetical protein